MQGILWTKAWALMLLVSIIFGEIFIFIARRIGRARTLGFREIDLREDPVRLSSTTRGLLNLFCHILLAATESMISGLYLKALLLKPSIPRHTKYVYLPVAVLFHFSSTMVLHTIFHFYSCFSYITEREYCYIIISYISLPFFLLLYGVFDELYPQRLPGPAWVSEAIAPWFLIRRWARCGRNPVVNKANKVIRPVSSGIRQRK